MKLTVILVAPTFRVDDSLRRSLSPDEEQTHRNRVVPGLIYPGNTGARHRMVPPGSYLWVLTHRKALHSGGHKEEARPELKTRILTYSLLSDRTETLAAHSRLPQSS